MQPPEKPLNHAHCHGSKVMPLENVSVSSQMIYTCPMHPEIRQSSPGACPKCGMALEPLQGSRTPPEDTEEYQLMLYRFWFSAVLTLPSLILTMGPMISGLDDLIAPLSPAMLNSIEGALALPIIFCGGAPLLSRGWRSLVTFNLNMFTLILLGIGISFIYSALVTLFPFLFLRYLDAKTALNVYYEPACMITTLVLLGQVIELKARSKTNLAISQLLSLSAKSAIKINEDHSEIEIAIDQITLGDKLRVTPGEKIPVDGIIIHGNSIIDQSMITGESVPVEKNTGDLIIGGTLNGHGSLIMQTTRVGNQTLLSKIITMVSEAQRSKAPIQKLVDKVAAYFVPTVIALSIITFIIWILLGPAPSLPLALLTSISMLMIACPCALGLATPLSIMMSATKGASDGILIKNAEALEKLSNMDILVIDKTGTLTEGTPSVQTVYSCDAQHVDWLQQAASLEMASEHPLSRAVIQEAQKRQLSMRPCSEFFYDPGKGLSGLVENHHVAIGNQPLMEGLGVDLAPVLVPTQPLLVLGHTLLYVAVDKQLAGFISITDPIKKNAKQVVQSLQKLGVEVIMLTGDNLGTATHIGQQLGITHIQADVYPQDKFKVIQQLQTNNHVVGMAGDGVNDAPALSQADIGIAMGSGTDIAIESAGITLIQGQLEGILKAINLSKATRKNIYQNLFLAFAYNGLAIPIAAGIFYPFLGILLSPMLASLAMVLSSLSVIFNALRLSKVKL